MNDRKLVISVGLAGLLILSAVGIVAAQSLEAKHAHEQHSGQITDITFDNEHNVVWSLDAKGGFIGYHVGEESLVESRDFETGHAIADGDGVVYVAVRNTLWEFDVENREWTTVTEELDSHAGALTYDAQRDVVWLAGGDGVYGYNVDDGSQFDSYSEHSDGVTSIDIQGDHLVSGSAWGVEAIVYDIPNGEVVYEPALPDDSTQVSAVHITASNQLLVGTDAEERSPVLMYDIGQQKQVQEYREHIFAVSDLAYDQAGRNIISFGSDNRIKIFSVEQETVIDTYQHDDTIFAGVFDAHNRLVWFGDGEDGPGTVIGVGASTSAEKTPTQTTTETSTETTMTTEQSPTTEESAGTTESEATTAGTTTGSGGAPGMGVLTVIAATLVLILRQGLRSDS